MTRKVEDTVLPTKREENTALPVANYHSLAYAVNGICKEGLHIAVLVGGGLRFILDELSNVCNHTRGTRIFFHSIKITALFR